MAADFNTDYLRNFLKLDCSLYIHCTLNFYITSRGHVPHASEIRIHIDTFTICA